MDSDVKAFRAAAERENGDRRGLQRRYPSALRGRAVRCWQTRQETGATLREVAVALGVAPWSLYRWTRASPRGARFHAVQVVPTASPAGDASLVTVVSAGHTRVEGLDVKSAARLRSFVRPPSPDSCREPSKAQPRASPASLGSRSDTSPRARRLSATSGWPVEVLPLTGGIATCSIRAETAVGATGADPIAPEPPLVGHVCNHWLPRDRDSVPEPATAPQIRGRRIDPITGHYASTSSSAMIRRTPPPFDACYATAV